MMFALTYIKINETIILVGWLRLTTNTHNVLSFSDLCFDRLGVPVAVLSTSSTYSVRRSTSLSFARCLWQPATDACRSLICTKTVHVPAWTVTFTCEGFVLNLEPVVELIG